MYNYMGRSYTKGGDVAQGGGAIPLTKGGGVPLMLTALVEALLAPVSGE